ncbi:MAG TPA: hypothetical protein VIL86_19305 [Tepidisphaeraceae bacterium]|jgi:hypothetical protein
MAAQVTKVDVWAGEMRDEPGGLARILDGLAQAGANIECVIARRQPEKPGTGVAFISPIKGKKIQDAARDVGLRPAANIGTLRIEGPNRAGTGARMMDAVRDAGVSMRGVSAMVLGNKYVVYIGFDSSEDATKAAKAIKAAEKSGVKSR